MKCKQIKEKIVLHSEGRLAPEEVVELKKHLVECHTCRMESEADAQLVRALSSLPGLEPESGGWERLAARIDAERAPSRTRLLKPVFAFTATAAVIIAILVISMPEQKHEQSVEVKPPIRKKHTAQKPDKPIVNVVELPTKDVKPEHEVKNVPRRSAAFAEKPRTHSKINRTTTVHKPTVQKNRVVVKHQTPVHKKPEILVQITGPEKTVAPDNVIAINTTTDAGPAVQEISEEMGNFITEGMSALLEANRDLYGLYEEKQL